MYLASGYVDVTGYVGDYWTRTTYSSANAYRLALYPTGINMNVANRYYAFSLRWLCLALKSRDNLRRPYLSD